jgi:hypothetical protein
VRERLPAVVAAADPVVVRAAGPAVVRAADPAVVRAADPAVPDADPVEVGIEAATEGVIDTPR